MINELPLFILHDFTRKLLVDFLLEILIPQFNGRNLWYTTSRIYRGISSINNSYFKNTAIVTLNPINNKFQRIEINKETEQLHLGRKKVFIESCRFTDSRISSTHCRLFVKDSKLFVEDLRFASLVDQEINCTVQMVHLSME